MLTALVAASQVSTQFVQLEDKAEKSGIINLTGPDVIWTLACVTNQDAEISPSHYSNVSYEYERLRDYQTSQGMCEDLGLNMDTPLPIGSVPGEVHQHLKMLGKTKNDVLHRFEHINQAWVAMQDWSYVTGFEMTIFDKLGKHYLRLLSIGTFANVYINGNLVGSIDNLYREYYLDVNQYTDVGQNTLRIDILSTVRKTYELKGAYTKQYEEGPQYFKEWMPYSFVSYARTQQTDFGWDWSPALAPQGIFDGAYLYPGSFLMEKPLIRTKLTNIRKSEKWP